MSDTKGGKKKTYELRATRTEKMDKDILDVPRASRLLGVSPLTISNLAHKGELPGRKVGREWRFTRAAILGWLNKSDPNTDADELLKNLLKNARLRK